VHVTKPVERAEGTSFAFRFTDVGEWHRRVFLDPESVSLLLPGIDACLRDEVAVHVVWEPQVRVGRIVITAHAGSLACPALKGPGGQLDLTPLTPLTRGLAAYRDDLAARKDLRLGAFKIGLFIADMRGGVSLWGGGRFVPDGPEWNRCVGVDGIEQCMPGETREGCTTFRLADGTARRRMIQLLAGSLTPQELLQVPPPEAGSAP